MKRIILIFSLILLVLFSALSIQAKPAQAKSYPTLTVTIVKNPITKHMYFAPTYPPCTYGYVKVKIINKTNTRATIQTDTGSIISIPPHATKYSYYIANDTDSFDWTMFEAWYYGGNAYIYFNDCVH